MRRGLVRATYALAGFVLVGGVLASCTLDPGPGSNPASSLPVVPVDAPPDLVPYYTQQVKWTTCPGNNDVNCTWVKVPLDYAKPTKGFIRLRVAYAPSIGSKSERLGYLFTNPGGPGGPGLEIPFDPGGYVSNIVRKHFDILGWDPRGVGASAPIECLTNKQTDVLVNINPSPTTPREIATYTAAQAAFAQACKVKNPRMYNHVGTVAAAHDMDIIRGVLGQPSMYYLGFSYGTYLGTWYAEQFPKRVARLVLDGAMNPALDNTQLGFEQLKGFERALYRFLEWCPSSSSCPKLFNVSEAARIQIIVAEQKLLAKQPAPTSDEQRPLTLSLFQLGLVYPLYDDAGGWPALADALNQLLTHDDGSAMLDMADAYLQRQPDGTYENNSFVAFNAIQCYDKPPTPLLAGTKQLAQEWSASYPVLGNNFAWSNMLCGLWPAHTDLKPAPLHAKGAAPIMVIGTTYDPATPYDEAVALSQQLDSGILVTWIGDGHTAYNRGSSCIQTTVDDYLLHGIVPKKGLVCPSIGEPR